MSADAMAVASAQLGGMSLAFLAYLKTREHGVETRVPSQPASGPVLAIFRHHACTRDIDLVMGDYARGCVAIAADTLAHVSFTHAGATLWEDVLSCMEGDLPVTVRVLPVPIESFGFGMTIDDRQPLIDEDVVARGAALCVDRARVRGTASIAASL